MKKLSSSRIEAIIAKTKAFYDTSATGCALLKVRSIATLPSVSIPLTGYDFPRDTFRYMDDRAAAYITVLEGRGALNDDTLPALGPWYGIAEHSAFLGGEVDYGEDTSWHHQLLDAPTELEKLSMSEENATFQMVIGGIAYLRDRYGDCFLPAVRGVTGALEIANTLRGSDFFYDFYEEPDALHALLDICADALVWYYNRQMEAAGDVFGGVVTGFGEWLPGRAIGHMSEDTTVMISAEQYAEFGRPRTQRVCDCFDGAFMHTHALGEHCLESIASIRGIRLMEISSDPNTDRAVEVWKRKRDALAGVIPVLRLTRAEIEGDMELLKGQKTIVWYDAVSMEDAEDMTRLFAREFPVR